MNKIFFYCQLLCASALLANAESADEMNQWLKPIREVIFISEWAATPKDVAFVKLSLLDNATAKVSESTSEQVPIGLSPMKKPNAMTERNLWKMSPGAEKSKEMSCISYQGYFVVISDKEVYMELKAYVPALVADSVSDRLFDSNEFVLVDAWRKARGHLKNNPKLLAALLNRLTPEQTEIVIQLLVEDADFPLETLRNQFDSLVRERKLEESRLLKALASSYWFASKSGEMDRAKKLVASFANKASGKDAHLVEVLKQLNLQE